MTKTKRFYNKIKSNTFTLLWSVVSATAVFLLCYFIDNLPYSFVGDATIGQHIEQVKQYFGTDTDSVPSDILLINIAYDRELVDVVDEFGFHKGNIDITDRAKLLEILKRLKKTDYKYILLDVAFASGYETSTDSALFSLIASMDNILIPKSENISLSDNKLYDKARYSDYSTHIAEYNFVKYEFLRNQEITAPYQLYLDIYHNEIKKWGPFYFFNGKLANKSVVLRHPIKLWNKYSINGESKNLGASKYFNLGSDILELDLDISEIANKKIVIIGDFTENDIHDTYMGKISGPAIIINAFYALKNDNLSLPYWYILFIIVLYTIISFCIIKRISFFSKFPIRKKIKSKTINFLISSLSITTLLTCNAVLIYIFFDLECNILIPSIYFSALLAFIKFKHYQL